MNKTVNLVLAFVLLLLVGCTGNEAMNSPSQVSNQQVTLSFFESSIRPMQSPQKVQSRAGDNGSKALKDCSFTYLHLVLIPTNGNGKTIDIVQDRNNTDIEFGKVSIKVPVGEYNMIAVASKNQNVQINSVNEVVFPDKVTDMAYVNEIIVVKTGNNSFSSLLKRAVAKFTIEDTGTQGYDATQLVFHLSGNCSNKFNPTTGFAADINPIDPVVAVIKGTNKYSVYAFLTSADEKDIKVDIDIKDKNGNLLKKLSFSNVNLKVGYITTYKGKLYEQSNEVDFSFTDTGFADSGAGTTFEE